MYFCPGLFYFQSQHTCERICYNEIDLLQDWRINTLKKIHFLLLMVTLLLLTSCTNLNSPNDADAQVKKGQSIDPTSFMRVHFINVGQADATLLQIKEDDELTTMLIDTGDWNRNDVVTYLEEENIEDIDLIVITHPHADHIGQLDKIIENFAVGEVWMNGDTSNSQVFANALAAIEKYEIDYYEPTYGEQFDIGNLVIDIVHPVDLSLGTNDNSISMRVAYGDISFLFTGDAEKAGEEQMLSSGANLKANILHLGHHGSNTSSTGNFLEAVQAKTAIYSAGIGNSYGHPDPEIIERVQKRNMDVYGTDIEGTIVIETDGQTYRIITEKQGSLPTPLLAKTCVDLNSASIEDLQKIIHIGEKSAAEIIEQRPFTTVDELIHINGIGEKRLEEIQAQNLGCIGG